MNRLLQSGFEIIPGVVSEGAIRSIATSLEYSPVQRSRAGIRNAFRVSTVRLLAKDEKLARYAKNVLGDGAIPFRATLFDKSPRANWLVVWHQDTALPIRERRDTPGWGPWSVKEGVTCAHAPASALEQILAIRVHLDDSNEDNGPLRILPGTHTTGVLSDDAICDLAKRLPAINCCVRAGGIVLMRPLIVHSSSKVRAENVRRRVLHIEYAAKLALADGLELGTD